MNSNTTANSNDNSFLCARYMVCVLCKLSCLFFITTSMKKVQMRSRLKEAKELGQNYSF